MNNDYLLHKLNEYILPKIKCKNLQKGRPYNVSNENVIKAIFYVLKKGITWETASELVLGDIKYAKTLNRRYNILVNSGIIIDT